MRTNKQKKKKKKKKKKKGKYCNWNSKYLKTPSKLLCREPIGHAQSSKDPTKIKIQIRSTNEAVENCIFPNVLIVLPWSAK